MLIVSGIFALAVYTALKIHTSEDISKMIPVDDELKRFNFANKQVKLNDKIIINISFEDTTNKVNPENLSAFSDTLTIRLQNKYSEHIAEIKNTIDNQMMSEL